MGKSFGDDSKKKDALEKQEWNEESGVGKGYGDDSKQKRCAVEKKISKEVTGEVRRTILETPFGAKIYNQMMSYQDAKMKAIKLYQMTDMLKERASMQVPFMGLNTEEIQALVVILDLDFG